METEKGVSGVFASVLEEGEAAGEIGQKRNSKKRKSL